MMATYIATFSGYGVVEFEAEDMEAARDQIVADLKNVGMKIEELELEEV